MFKSEKLNYLDFDIYSRRISFFYKNKEKMGSSFGFILTILYAIISIILFLIYFIKTIKRDEVSTSISTIYPSDIPSINLNNNIFYLAFGLEIPNKLNRFIDETIYYPKVSYIERIKENGVFITKSEKHLDFERCDGENFGKNYQHLFEKDEFNNSYCLKDFNLSLIGGFKYNKMSYIRINIYPCVNNTKNNNHCKPQDIIDKYLTATYFSGTAKDIGFNPFNYSFPIVPTLQDLYTSIDKSFYKEYIMYFGLAEINTDKGFISTNINKENYIKYIKNYESFFFLDNDDYLKGKKIFSAQIRLEDNIYFINRKYTKMSEVFSTTGGYMQVIYTIFALIATLTKKISIELNLLNSLFNFDIKHKKILLSIEYGKKLDYNFSLEKGKLNKYIPYEARKSIISKKDRRNSIIFLNNTHKLKKVETEQEQSPVYFNNIKSINKISEEGLIDIVNNIPKEKEKDKKINMNDISINRSNNNMIFKEDKLDLNNNKKDNNENNSIIDEKKNRRNSNFNSFNILKNFDKGRRSTINFNLFDYYCFKKLTKKSTEIELFNFGINFFKSQMDIINFFNILILTQIMLTQQQTDKKHNILNQILELSIK
jgi:hypothetical protein